MKITRFRWHWAMPLAAALALNMPLAQAQEPFSAVDLIKPIEAAPIEAVPIQNAPEEQDVSAEPSAPVEPAPLDAAPIELATPEAPTPASSGVPATVDRPVERIQERFPNGALRVEREMIQDEEGNFLRHGIYREYDLKGTLIVEGEYRMGQREGIWQRLHTAAESPLFQTAPYKDFSGPFLSQVNFTNNRLDGKWIIADSQQRKISEISFTRGERNGPAIWYYPNGVVMTQISYEEGRVHGEIVSWGSDSTVLAKEKFKHGRKVSVRIDYFSKDTKRREVNYLDAMLYARTPDDWDKALLATFETRGQDEKHGPFTTWHASGNVARKGEFRYNLPVGKIEYWYENGQRQMEGEYVDGKSDGIWTWYHANGQKSIVGEYRDGVAIGQWTWWHEDGKVAKKADFSAQQPAPIVQGLPQPTPHREANIRIELVEPKAVQR